MSDIVQTRYGPWDRQNDPCPGCGDGDKVPHGEAFLCPVCDAEWEEEDFAPMSDTPTGSAPDQPGQGSFAALIPSAQTVKPAPYAFEFISSHKGGQHTNGPDYGVVRVTDMDGNAVEVRTRPRRVGHQARELAISLLDLLNEEPR